MQIKLCRLWKWCKLTNACKLCNFANNEILQFMKLCNFWNNAIYEIMQIFKSWNYSNYVNYAVYMQIVEMRQIMQIVQSIKFCKYRSQMLCKWIGRMGFGWISGSLVHFVMWISFIHIQDQLQLIQITKIKVNSFR